MSREELMQLKVRMAHIAESLYQNRVDGMQEVVEVLPQIQELVKMSSSLSVEQQLLIVQIMRSLLEGYQNQDVLLLADTLYYQGAELASFYLAQGD